VDAEKSARFDISNPGAEESYELLGLPFSWRLDEGIFRYAGIQSVMFWAPTSLAEFLASMHRIAGEERYAYILQAQGRQSEQDDWNFISSFPSFFEGLRGINRVAVSAGWGRMELVDYQPEQRRAVMRIYNAWEAACQQAMGVCWGTHYFAGKLAGWFSRHFGVNCWCTQLAFIAKGDRYDEFSIAPSPTTVEEELARIERSEQERRAGAEAEERQRQLEAQVEQRTRELSSTIERLEQAQSSLQSQALTIQRLSIPIVQLWDGILMVSLIGEIDSQRAQQLIETLLEAISQRHAGFVLLDITGVSVVDSSVADYLIRTVQAVKLLGAQAILVGISPEVAQSLVTLQVDLGSITTCSDLGQGLKRAFQAMGLSVRAGAT
jgi:rsbT co-antagonist protein RsbR